MFINLPDRIPTAQLAEEIALVIRTLEGNRVASIGEVHITLRAFNLDDREYYPADAHGRHDMGFTISRPGRTGGASANAFCVSWNVPGSKPKPVEHDGLRGLWDLFPGATSDAD